MCSHSWTLCKKEGDHMPRDIFLNWRNVALSQDFEDLVKDAKSWTKSGEYEAMVLPWGKTYHFWELMVRRIPEPTIQTQLNDFP